MQINYLRPNQIDEIRGEIKSCEKALSPENRNDSRLDKKSMARQLQVNQQMLHEQAPPVVENMDALVKETNILEEKIKIGMPSQEEMRKNPAGAVGKHLKWQNKNKQNVQNWKNNQLILNNGDNDPDIANIERLRGTKNSLNMDNVQIVGQDIYFPPGQIPVNNAMSDDDREKIEHNDKRVKEEMKALNDKGLLSESLCTFYGLEKKKNTLSLNK